CLWIASPSSVQPVNPSRRCSASARESFIVISSLRLRPQSANLVEPDARSLHGGQRLLLHLDRTRSLGRAHERAARNGPMVRALRELELIERGRMLALPFEPARQPLCGLVFGGARALDAERITC